MFSMKSWDIFRTGLWRQNQLFQVKTWSPPHPNQVVFIPKTNKHCCHNVKMKLNLKLQHKTDFKLKHIRGFTENLSQKAGSDQLWVLFYMKTYFVQIHKRKMCTPLPLQSLNYWNTTLAVTLCYTLLKLVLLEPGNHKNVQEVWSQQDEEQTSNNLTLSSQRSLFCRHIVARL